MEQQQKPRGRRKKQAQEALFPAPRRVLVTGATGFVGRTIVAELLARGYQVVALARQHPPRGGQPGLVRVAADAAGDGWERWAEGCDAVIHLVGIIRENPKAGVTFHQAHVATTAKVLEVCGKLAIRRLLHMSALGADPQGPVPYQRTKGEAEALVRSSGLDWTIFRPSVIFGPGDGFTSTLAAVVRRFPVVPVFGDGSYPLHPVAVEEVAEAFVRSLELPETVGKTIELGGPEVLSYLEVLRRIASSLGRKRVFLKLPWGISRLAVRLAAALLPDPPITPDELAMLAAGSRADTSLAQALFGLPRKRFSGLAWPLEPLAP